MQSFFNLNVLNWKIPTPADETVTNLNSLVLWNVWTYAPTHTCPFHHAHTLTHLQRIHSLLELTGSCVSDFHSQLSVSLPSEPWFLIRELAAVSPAKIHTVIHLTLSTLWLMPCESICQNAWKGKGEGERLKGREKETEGAKGDPGSQGNVLCWFPGWLY